MFQNNRDLAALILVLAAMCFMLQTACGFADRNNQRNVEFYNEMMSKGFCRADSMDKWYPCAAVPAKPSGVQ